MASSAEEKESSLMLSKNNQLLLKSHPLLRSVSSDVKVFEMRVANLVIASDDNDEEATGEKTSSDQKAMTRDQVVAQGVESVRCECCGMSEECTPTYIRRIRDSFHGKWVCGLCSEAINLELQMKRGAHPTSSPPLMITKEEALAAHMSLCSKFNRTVRMNPKLSLALSMRDIAKKCSQRRTTTTAAMVMPNNNIARAISCGPRLEL